MCETEHLKKATYTIRQYTEDEKLRMIAEAREEQQRSEKSAISFWKKEGYKEGLKEGRIIVVTNLINEGVDKDFITSLGYTEAEYSAAYKRLYPLMK